MMMTGAAVLGGGVAFYKRKDLAEKFAVRQQQSQDVGDNSVAPVAVGLEESDGDDLPLDAAANHDLVENGDDGLSSSVLPGSAQQAAPVAPVAPVAPGVNGLVEESDDDGLSPPALPSSRAHQAQEMLHLFNSDSAPARQANKENPSIGSRIASGLIWALPTVLVLSSIMLGNRRKAW